MVTPNIRRCYYRDLYYKFSMELHQSRCKIVRPQVSPLQTPAFICWSHGNFQGKPININILIPKWLNKKNKLCEGTLQICIQSLMNNLIVMKP
jgi:hypothetical protein